MIYAAFIGVLLASYASPIQSILTGRAETPALEERLQNTRDSLAAQENEVEALSTPEGIERAARERYGMILPGEKVYPVPKAEDAPDNP